MPPMLRTLNFPLNPKPQPYRPQTLNPEPQTKHPSSFGPPPPEVRTKELLGTGEAAKDPADLARLEGTVWGVEGLVFRACGVEGLGFWVSGSVAATPSARALAVAGQRPGRAPKQWRDLVVVRVEAIVTVRLPCSGVCDGGTWASGCTGASSARRNASDWLHPRRRRVCKCMGASAAS